MIPNHQKDVKENVPAHENVSDTVLKQKFLPSDQVEISEASRKKLSESEEKDQEQVKDTDQQVMKKEAVAEGNQTSESDIDKEISKLSIEILELTVQIEMLKTKEDGESTKERQSLETDLAVKKGVLEATIDKKLQMATQSS
jgi:hypothetical protein